MVFGLCLLYLPPVVGPRLSLDKIYLDVVRKDSNLQLHTCHTLVLEGGAPTLDIAIFISFSIFFGLRVLRVRP